MPWACQATLIGWCRKDVETTKEVALGLEVTSHTACFRWYDYVTHLGSGGTEMA